MRDGYVCVAETDDLPVGEGMPVRIGERLVALFHTDRGWFALDDTCPHRGMPLSDGRLDGETVTCAWHAWNFDLRTGAMALGASEGVAAYEVRVEGADVLVALHPTQRSGAAAGKDLPTGHR